MATAWRHIKAFLSVFMEVDSQTADRDAKNFCGVRAIVLAMFERVEDVLTFKHQPTSDDREWKPFVRPSLRITPHLLKPFITP